MARHAHALMVVVEPVEGAWHAYCPVLLDYGAATWGATREEALDHICEVVRMIVARMAEDGASIPLAPAPNLTTHDSVAPGPAAAERRAVDVQVSLRDPTARGFTPLPVRWRIEATFGTLTNRYRRLTRNLEQSGEAAENVIEMTSAGGGGKTSIRRPTVGPTRSRPASAMLYQAWEVLTAGALGPWAASSGEATGQNLPGPVLEALVAPRRSAFFDSAGLALQAIQAHSSKAACHPGFGEGMQFL